MFRIRSHCPSPKSRACYPLCLNQQPRPPAPPGRTTPGRFQRTGVRKRFRAFSRKSLELVSLRRPGRSKKDTTLVAVLRATPRPPPPLPKGPLGNTMAPTARGRPRHRRRSRRVSPLLFLAFRFRASLQPSRRPRRSRRRRRNPTRFRTVSSIASRKESASRLALARETRFRAFPVWRFRRRKRKRLRPSTRVPRSSRHSRRIAISCPPETSTSRTLSRGSLNQPPLGRPVPGVAPLAPQPGQSASALVPYQRRRHTGSRFRTARTTRS